jgi:hypothetical protein
MTETPTDHLELQNSYIDLTSLLAKRVEELEDKEDQVSELSA